MIKQYIVNGKQYQFAEGEQPVGAVELKADDPQQKAATPTNKSARPANKARKAGSK